MKKVSNTASEDKNSKEKGIFVLIDETHRYLRKELVDMVDFMAALAKQGRKRYAEMCIISQNISDFYRQSDSKDVVQKAQDVVKNCGYKFIMQLAQDYDLVKDFISSSFDLTQKDDNFIRSLSKGMGYLVQGPLEQMGIKVQRLQAHDQLEKDHRIIIKKTIIEWLQSSKEKREELRSLIYFKETKLFPGEKGNIDAGKFIKEKGIKQFDLVFDKLKNCYQLSWEVLEEEVPLIKQIKQTLQFIKETNIEVPNEYVLHKNETEPKVVSVTEEEFIKLMKDTIQQT
jgi:hypothetical protein